MVYFDTSQEWLQQSSLLLKARPSTTKITTQYRIRKSIESATRRRRGPEQTTQDSDAPQAQAGPKAMLTLKTWDPQSGVCLKYKTDKAAELGRLIASLGRLGRQMAALPEIEDTVIMDAAPAEQGSGTQTLMPEASVKDAKAESKTLQGVVGASGGSSGKKKKKGKR